MFGLLQPLLVVLHLVVPGALRPPVLAQPEAVQLGAIEGARRATDRASAELATTAGLRSQTLVDKQRLAGQYDRELAELDRLKRTRASWRRDRQIAGKKADSQATARKLAALELQVRGLDARLFKARRGLLAAVDGELAAGSARAARLRSLRAEIDGQLRPRARKLILPDEALDELADPDELAEQIALLERAEGELRREQRLLTQREERYGRMARLREQRERAAELSQPDDEAVRRTTGSENPKARGDGASAEPSPGGGGEDDSGSLDGAGGGAPPPSESPDDGAGFVASSVVLADVLDRTTADALRRAGRSSDPRGRADAAARAKRQVDERLRRLERSRLLIERHMRKLDR